MTSPAPEATAAADPRPLDAAATKDLKPEMNGTSPSEPAPESKAESEKPALNGDGKSGEPAPINGATGEDVTMGNGDDAQPTESAPATADAGSNESANDSKPAETSDAPPTLAETSKPESPKDVEMADSKPAEESPRPSQDKEGEAQSAKEPVAEAPSAPENPAPADVANADVKEATTESASEAVQKSPEAPAQADQATADAAKPAVSTSEVDLQPASLSQLAIETPVTDASPVLTSVEVSMTDAPGAKVAREREDDTTEEPASKRAKTEPKEDEPSTNKPTEAKASTDTPAPAASFEQSAAPTQGGALSFGGLPKFNDPEFNARVIQPFQKRDLRRSMARVKKTKNGGHFKDSVQRLWPALWDKYIESIAKPMDLGEIDRSLRDDKYKTFGEVRNDLVLIAENSMAYNGPDHYMTMAAKAAIKSVWDDVMAIPEEEPVKHKPAPKQSRVARDARTSNVKAEGTGAVDRARPHAGSPAAAPKAAPAADARRPSTTADVDRPKRTVRAPKPKDIDYTTKPSRKKLKPELQFCDEVLSELMRDKYHHLNQWFNEPVDAVALKIPHYYSIVTEPMDLGKIQRMLYGGEISNFKEFDKYVRLVFSNCYKFNGPPEPGNVSFLAEQLEHIYNRQVKGKDAWLAKHAKANPPPASASTGSDEEEDDEEDEGEDAGPDPTREVKDLEVRLREEMDKQANLFAAEHPNQSMIQIQQGIVNMVQQALLQAKQKLNEYKQKNGAAAAKSKKSKAKPKTGGGGGGRKSGGAAAQPKKATGGGGHKKKKNLTAADKDNIAGAINDLEYPHLDKAIDIIKRDTGQMESEDGELELDIDQLSHEALLKLWELCKKVLPGFGKDPAAAANPPSPEVARAAPSKQSKTAAKPKKNKPMSADEQEARIAQLREIRELYKPGQPVDEAQLAQEAAAMDDSSDDSSEEE